MAKDTNRLRRIYSKTDGYCHLCHRKLSFKNYGKAGQRGGWHVEHSIPRAKNGTDHLNNLFAACVDCNIEKGTYHTSTIRKRNGVTRAPYSRKKKESIRNNNTTAGVIIGGLIGMVGGPLGAAVGATIGGVIGNKTSPNR